MYGVQRVYLATDSQDMLQAAPTLPDFEIVFLNVSREMYTVQSGGHFVEARLAGTQSGRAASEFTKNKGTIFSENEKYLASVGAAADVLLMQQGDIFLGTTGSVFSRIGYYSMAGNKGVLPPYSTVDGIPLCCNGVSSCAIEAMHKDRKMTITQCMIFA